MTKNRKFSDYLTIRQVMEYTGKGRSTIHYHLKRGVWPGAIAIGDEGPIQNWLIPWEEVEKWKPDGPGRKVRT